MDPLACICKVIQKLESDEDIIQHEDTVKLRSILCKIGSFALKKSLPGIVLERIIKLLADFHSKGFVNPSSTGFLLEASKYVKKDEKQLSCNAKLLLISKVPATLEAEIFHLLNTCINVNTSDKLGLIKKVVQCSCLPQACSANSEIFQKVLNVFGNLWFKSDGNVAVTYLMVLFFKTVQEYCSEAAFINLFPSQLGHIALILSIQPHDFNYGAMVRLFREHIIQLCIESLEAKLCTEEDIVLLMILFPSWYHEFLQFYDDEERPYSTEIFYQRIWNFCSIEEAKDVLHTYQWCWITSVYSIKDGDEI